MIGGGTGGCVVARRLIDGSDARVLLLEAGPPDRGVAALTDAAAWVALQGGPYDWGYVYAPSPAVAGRAIPIPRGRVLGGSSSINAMLWYRGHPSDYDGWAAAGATGWDFASVLPFFKRAEDWHGGETAFRGAGGPLRIEQAQDPHPLALALIAAAAERGIPVIDDANGATNEGAALADFNMRGSERWSAARGYLWPVLDHPRLTVMTQSMAETLVFEGGCCVGVNVRAGGDRASLRATRDVVLCAGAIDTPRLLMRSGIGGGDQLRRLGAPVVADLKGVGQNLQDHPLLTGLNFHATAPLGPVRGTGGGSMVNWRSSQSAIPDLHAFLVQGLHALPHLAQRHAVEPPVFAISPGLMGSRSRGFLRMHGLAPDATVEIQPNLLQEPADVAALVEAIDVVMDLAETAALRPHVRGPAIPDRRLSRAEREEFVRQATSTFFHCCGTCAMGSGEMAVVDPQLRVRGVEGLRIADASVMPTIPSCNTNAPVAMIGERAAAFILAA